MEELPKKIQENLNENPNKDFLLSDDYKKYGWLTEDEKESYLSEWEKIQQGLEVDKFRAYKFLREIYKKKSDKNFLDSVEKVHWVNKILDIENILNNGNNINYDISTEGYYKESLVSAWGSGIGLKLKGDTIMASNTDLRSDNRDGNREDGSFKKYSYGDSTSIILNEETFLKHKDLEYTSRGKVFKGHNEFLLENSEVEAIVIDESNKDFDNNILDSLKELSNKYNVPIIYSK